MLNSMPKDITEDGIQSGMEDLERNETILAYNNKNVVIKKHEKHALQVTMFWYWCLIGDLLGADSMSSDCILCL